MNLARLHVCLPTYVNSDLLKESFKKEKLRELSIKQKNMETGTNGKRTIQPKIPENSGGKSNGTDIPGTKFSYTLQSHPLFGKLENAVQLFTGYFWKFNLNFFSCIECTLLCIFRGE